VSLSSDHKALALIRNGSNNICFVIFLLQALEIDKENVKAIFRRGKVWFFWDKISALIYHFTCEIIQLPGLYV